MCGVGGVAKLICDVCVCEMYLRYMFCKCDLRMPVLRIWFAHMCFANCICESGCCDFAFRFVLLLRIWFWIVFVCDMLICECGVSEFDLRVFVFECNVRMLFFANLICECCVCKFDLRIDLWKCHVHCCCVLSLVACVVCLQCWVANLCLRIRFADMLVAMFICNLYLPIWSLRSWFAMLVCVCELYLRSWCLQMLFAKCVFANCICKCCVCEVGLRMLLLRSWLANLVYAHCDLRI